ncbi:MAG: TlpA family protein disulfide reductase [Gammaproteobacteria bacterium]|nr:TlpA family protein disulfide reductase [Gammaproteobacteria bacterium]
MINKLSIGLIVMMWASGSISGVTLKAFQTGSINEISAERKGQSFMVVLWSVHCPPCLMELVQLQQYKNRFSKSSLVLVATDGLQYSDTVQQILYDKQLDQMDNWIFAGPMPERLRFAIDPSWYGELPRTYFYDSAHQRSSHSGALTQSLLKRWLN